MTSGAGIQQERAHRPATSTAPVTAIIPIHRTKGNREWLQQAINSLAGCAHVLVAENDGEVEQALQRGLEACETEFYIPFGSDDIAHPDYLKRLLAFAYEADLVYPGLQMTTEDLKIHGGPMDADPYCPLRLERLNFIPGPSLVRTEKAREVGGYRELGALEDWDLWMRMARAGARIKPAPGAMVFYRQHGKGRNVEVRLDAEMREEYRQQIAGDVTPALATFYCQATAATTYLRCQLPARYLPGVVYPHAIAAVSEEDVVFPDHEGAAIFQFAGDQSRALVSQAMMTKGIRVLIEADDNYLLGPAKANRKQWSRKIGDKPHSTQGHKWIVKHADGMIVTTPWMADAYRKINPNVYVCPNSVDPIDWPEPAEKDDDVLRIGWMASDSHSVDVELLTRAFEWASRQKDVEIYVGGLAPRWKFPYIHVPWIEDLHAYRSVFQTFDINVCPVRRLPFAMYRSDVKALEGAMGGACNVLSDVPPYDSWVDGENCMKVADAKGFFHAIKHLVANRDEVKQLAQAGREYTLTHRTTEAVIHTWHEALSPD